MAITISLVAVANPRIAAIDEACIDRRDRLLARKRPRAIADLGHVRAEERPAAPDRDAADPVDTQDAFHELPAIRSGGIGEQGPTLEADTTFVREGDRDVHRDSPYGLSWIEQTNTRAPSRLRAFGHSARLWQQATVREEYFALLTYIL
jgi:hypothetical protein